MKQHISNWKTNVIICEAISKVLGSEVAHTICFLPV